MLFTTPHILHCHIGTFLLETGLSLMKRDMKIKTICEKNIFVN